MAPEYKEIRVAFIKPPKSPCRKCRFIDADKNCFACQVCKRRIRYLVEVDPEFNLVLARYNFSGGKPKHIDRDPETKKERTELEKEINEFARLYCEQTRYSWEQLLNTRTKDRAIVTVRRDMIRTIKEKYNVFNTVIGRGIGLGSATVSLALKGADCQSESL